jgi:Flp pilus assembly protein TadD
VDASRGVSGDPRAQEYAARLEAGYGELPEVHFFRGTLFGFEGNRAEAEREYRATIEISSTHAEALTALAAIDLDRANYAEAGELARRAIAADPKSPEAHHQLGRVLLADGQFPQAAKELETARGLNPGNPQVRSQLAKAYVKLGKEEQAKAEIEAFNRLKAQENTIGQITSKLAAPAAEKDH